MFRGPEPPGVSDLGEPSACSQSPYPRTMPIHPHTALSAFIIALLARALLKIRTKMQAYVYGWVLSLGLMKLYYWSNLEKHALLRIEKRMWLKFFFFF